MVHVNKAKCNGHELKCEKSWSEKNKYNESNQILEQVSQCGVESPPRRCAKLDKSLNNLICC